MSTNALGETRGLDGLLADVLANLLAGRPL
jgi:hypothetical protein